MQSEKTKLKSGDCDIFIGDPLLNEISLVLEKYSSIFILTDSGVKKQVVPTFKEVLPQLKDKNIISIKSGGHNKQLATCELVWNKLTKLGADRYSLLINIGGGAVCDLGGFVASTYMRGIEYINIPTTLLAMVDASIGGKVGIDFKGLKNHIGLFSLPEAVFICPQFLNTLSMRLILCGYAEMLKHALIADSGYWKDLKHTDLKSKDVWYQLVKRSVEIKKKITEGDPEEKGKRKLLNFGHTAGHALEAWCIKKNDNSIMHGEAVAWGILVESYLSYKGGNLPLSQLQEITSVIKGFYKLKLPLVSSGVLISLMRSDKKNRSNRINFTALSKIAKADIDRYYTDEIIKEAIEYANGQF
jgi:3-dehydroquinate synthase